MPVCVWADGSQDVQDLISQHQYELNRIQQEAQTTLQQFMMIQELRRYEMNETTVLMQPSATGQSIPIPNYDDMLKDKQEKKARILVASTSEVYGDPLVHPQNEEYYGNVSPIGPRGVYDEAKRFQEAMTMAYHNYHGIETRIIRIFNTYGPRMRVNDGRALPAFFSQAIRGEGITIFGDGSQTRSFCYVDDLVEGIHRLLLSDYHLPVNIGNPVEISILGVAEEVMKLVDNKEAKITFQGLPKDDPKVRKPNITKAKEILGWEPKIDRAEGLRRTYEYFKTVVK